MSDINGRIREKADAIEGLARNALAVEIADHPFSWSLFMLAIGAAAGFGLGLIV